MTEKRLVHATCVALGAHGLLIMGPPGSGKSDLALRLIDSPGRGIGSETMTARLVSDDQTLIERRDDRLIAAAPQGIAGKLEIRGLGIVEVPQQSECALSMIVRLEPSSDIERLPEEQSFMLLGLALPEMSVDGASASAPARIRAALGHMAEG